MALQDLTPFIFLKCKCEIGRPDSLSLVNKKLTPFSFKKISPKEVNAMTDQGKRKPPNFCQYSNGACDQVFDGTLEHQGIFLYPEKPEEISRTIEASVQKLKQTQRAAWDSWKNFKTSGQVIFCAICKSFRYSEIVVADVTTLNFNLLFEIGFALGLEMPVLPIRDTTFIRDKHQFEELGLLDTIGYVDFQNSEDLVARLNERASSVESIPSPPSKLKKDSPLFVLKSPINTEGSVRLMSTLKKSWFHFRTFDPIETPRLSLHEARKQVSASLGVIAHLLSPDRQGYLVHNARCALVAGIAMASNKAVLMLQEGTITQPIDYRDVVSSYTDPAQVPKLLLPFIRNIIEQFQDPLIKEIKRPEKLLEQLDIGDLAAENEIRPLRSYFLRTGQFNEARRGHARLVIGRKGGGKTAIFYGVRDTFINRKSHLVLDLKPEGHQLVKLREVILSKLSPGHQGHTLTGFWNLILLLEIAHKIYQTEKAWAQSDQDRYQRYEKLCDVYIKHGLIESGDLSERLLRQVDRITDRFRDLEGTMDSGKITQQLFTVDIKELDTAITQYLKDKDEIWFLFDNLDKGWPTRGAAKEDILIITTLLDATRKLQRQFEDLGVDFRCLIFLRSDIYELLIAETSDRGKDTAITLDWNDPEVFKEMVRLRISSTGKLSGSFDEIWPVIFDSHIGTQDSFQYMLERTLMRPRDLLSFLRRAIEVAVNRGHDRITQDDILMAESHYSDDMLLSTAFELKDIYSFAPNFLYVFLGCSQRLSINKVRDILIEAKFTDQNWEEGLKLLVWFGFLGVEDPTEGEAQFSYHVRYNINKLLAPAKNPNPTFIIHPAYRKALECTE